MARSQRIHPMDSQRYDITKRTWPRPKLNDAVERPTWLSYFRFDSLLLNYKEIRLRRSMNSSFPSNESIANLSESKRHVPRICRLGSVQCQSLIPDTLATSEDGKPLRYLSRMDSQRYDPLLKSKVSYTTIATKVTLGHSTIRNILCESPEPMTRESDDDSAISPTDGSSQSTRDGIFASDASAASSDNQSDTSTPWRRESYLYPTGSNYANDGNGGEKVDIPLLYVVKTLPPGRNILRSLDCRNTTFTMFDVVPPVPNSHIPSVVRVS